LLVRVDFLRLAQADLADLALHVREVMSDPPLARLAQQAVHGVAREGFEGPDLVAAVERSVVAAKLGESLFDQDDPQLLALWLREEQRGGPLEQRQVVVHRNDRPFLRTAVVQSDGVLTALVELLRLEDRPQQPLVLGHAREGGDEPAVA